MSAWNSINHRIADCAKCPRLRQHCRDIAQKRRRAYHGWNYWGRPVPNFGDRRARLLIVGLAPAAHGANRTGRMFTGDRSGDWLYRALYKAGLASQTEAVSREDGLQLADCAITAICHCAPPANKPTSHEITACRPWLSELVDILPVQVFLALGGLAWRGCLDEMIARGWYDGRRPKFSHGAAVPLAGDRWLLASYHPSQQNTFTGRLTATMLDEVIARAVDCLENAPA